MPLNLLRYVTLVTDNPDLAPLDAPEERLLIMLQVFFVDPLSFMEALDLSGAIISGSFVLAFVLGVVGWQYGDLDLFVDLAGAEVMLQYLVEEAGYSVVLDVANHRCVSTTPSLSLFTDHQ